MDRAALAALPDVPDTGREVDDDGKGLRHRRDPTLVDALTQFGLRRADRRKRDHRIGAAAEIMDARYTLGIEPPRSGGAGAGGLLGGGLSELTDRFRQNGHGEKVDSWVGTGPNRDVAPNDLEQAIGPDVLQDLTEQTGLSRDELLSRLSRELPNAVDQYTPHGRLPADADVV